MTESFLNSLSTHPDTIKSHREQAKVENDVFIETLISLLSSAWTIKSALLVI